MNDTDEGELVSIAPVRTARELLSQPGDGWKNDAVIRSGGALEAEGARRSSRGLGRASELVDVDGALPKDEIGDLLASASDKRRRIAEGPFDDKPRAQIEVRATMLTGEHAVAYQAFCFAAASLEQANVTAKAAQVKYVQALNRLSTLAAGTVADPTE